jgi:adenylate cyclase class 2
VSFEVEQKFVIPDSRAVADQLVELGAELRPPISQVDTYYRHPSRDFAHTDEALRIRRTDGQNYITYKGPKIDQTTKTRREIDIRLLPDDTTVGQFAAMLQALGFQEIAQVRKVRTPGALAWDGWRVETAIDDVSDLGHFAELEVTAAEQDVDRARNCIQSLAMRLNLTMNERRSYLELLLAR